jgi:hypothetical protein
MATLSKRWMDIMSLSPNQYTRASRQLILEELSDDRLAEQLDWCEQVVFGQWVLNGTMSMAEYRALVEEEVRRRRP